MNLVIHAHTFKNEAMPRPAIGQFGPQGGTIGRAPSNTLCLPDPERHISRLHAEIVYNVGGFAICNVGSANPIVVNGRVLLPRETISLCHGDEIMMGAYGMRAELTAAAQPNTGHDAAPGVSPEQVAAFSSVLEAAAIPPPPEPRPWYKFGASDAPPEIAAPAPTSAPMPLQPSVHHLAETTMPAVRVAREAPFTIAPAKPMPPIPGPQENPAPDTQSGVLDSGLGIPNDDDLETTPFPTLDTPKLPEPRPPASPSELALWSAFCHGAGINTDPAQHLTPELMNLIGRILHQSIHGTLKLVALRTAAKQELRAQVTTIQSRNNNPLKFSPDASTAIEQLLQPASRGFTVGPAAITDTMDDLIGHMSGTMIGMRAAVKGALERFEPQHLESKLSTQRMIGTLVPMHRRAKLWELYLEHHENIQNEAEDNFHELFGKAFLKAYDEQLDRLQRERGGQY
jgi:FHA domain-containing protein